MIISRITDGIGNQLFQYAFGRCLAYKWNTELKFDLTFYDSDHLRPCTLNFFNTKATLATPEEIARVKNSCGGVRQEEKRFMPEILDYPDDVWLYGYWGSEKYFADIRDILLNEFSLRQPIGVAAQHWKEKIFAAECSVSVHFRHGDFAYSPINVAKPNAFAIVPLNYYYECINVLKQQYKNLTLFIFSNNLQWVKENFRPGVPIEFVEGEGLEDFEELHLMSLCKHNIIANSTFSQWGAWLNQNPDKKVFRPLPTSDAAKVDYQYVSTGDENSLLDMDKWIGVPFDINKQPEITQKPYFSLLLVVNDDAATLNETLDSILGQDYKYYELIIIDDASTDGSGKICRQVAQTYDNVTLIKLWNKIPDGAAYNKALDLAQGDSVLFLKGNDRIFPDALTYLYLVNERPRVDVVNSVAWLHEDERGGISMAGRKFALETDAAFRGSEGSIRTKLDKPTLFKIFAANEAATPLATKMFRRKFLTDNDIRFNEQNDAEATRLFAIEAMLQADEMIFTPNLHYIAPRK